MDCLSLKFGWLCVSLAGTQTMDMADITVIHSQTMEGACEIHTEYNARMRILASNCGMSSKSGRYYKETMFQAAEVKLLVDAVSIGQIILSRSTTTPIQKLSIRLACGHGESSIG